MAGPSTFRPRMLAAAGLAISVCVGLIGESPSPVMSITLTGQSMIRSDIRAHSPDVVSTWARLLKADVVFTNFESTVVENGEPLAGGRFLTPPKRWTRWGRSASTCCRSPTTTR